MRNVTRNKLETGNIILVGMMGAGKTTVGKLLAKHLGKTFIDSDEEIQRRTGVNMDKVYDMAFSETIDQVSQGPAPNKQKGQ